MGVTNDKTDSVVVVLVFLFDVETLTLCGRTWSTVSTKQALTKPDRSLESRMIVGMASTTYDVASRLILSAGERESAESGTRHSHRHSGHRWCQGSGHRADGQ